MYKFLKFIPVIIFPVEGMRASSPFWGPELHKFLSPCAWGPVLGAWCCDPRISKVSSYRRLFRKKCRTFKD